MLGRLKQHTFMISVSVTQGFRSRIAGQFWFTVSHGVAGSYQLGLLLSKGLTGERSISKLVHEVIGRSQLYTGC